MMERERPKRNRKAVERFSHEGELRKSNWTEDEKTAFYRALLQHGYGDMEKLCAAVPTKTKTHVRNFLEWARSNGMFKYETGKEPPLETWLKLLEYRSGDSIDLSKTPQHLLPMMMRMIAETEQHPPPEQCGGIDFRLLYLALGQCFEGTGLSGLHLNEPTAKFLQKQMSCLDNMILVQNLSKEKDLLCNHTLNSIQVNAAYSLNAAAAQTEIQVPLQQNELWNPLKIPENLLQFNFQDMTRHYPIRMGPDLPFSEACPKKSSREVLKTVESESGQYVLSKVDSQSIDVPSATVNEINSMLLTIPPPEEFGQLDPPCSNPLTLEIQNLGSMTEKSPNSDSPDSNIAVEPICQIDELDHAVDL